MIVDRRSLRLMLVALVVVEVANLGSIASEHGIPKLDLALLLIAMLGIAGWWLRGGDGPAWSPVLWFAAAFFAARAVSIIEATDHAAAMASLVDLAKGLVIFAVVLTLCVRTEGERLVAGAMVTTAAILCLLELVQQFVLHNSTTFFGLSKGGTVVDIGLAVGRHSGPLDDHNFWGRVLIMVAPLALSLFADRGAGRKRWWWFVAFLLVLAAVYLTGSRGALLIVAIVIVVWCLLAGRRYRRKLLFAPLVAGVVLLVPGVGSRLASIDDVATTTESQADSSLIGRVQAQQVGMLMFFDHPALGVGPGNFEVVEPRYQREHGIDGPVLAPHDLYLEMAAESGLLGLAGWLGLYGCGLLIAIRARLFTRPRAPNSEPSADWLLATGTIAGLIGWGLNGVLLHLSTFPVLGFLFAIAVGLDARARRQATHMPLRPARTQPVRRWAPAMVFAVAGGLGLLIPGVFTPQWSASVQLQVAPHGDRPDAYSLAVASRQPVVLTYLSLFGDAGLRRLAESRLGVSSEQLANTTVTASVSGSAPLVTVTATGPQAETARRLANEFADVVTTYVDGLRPLYRLQVAGRLTITRTTVIQPAAAGALFSAAAVLAVATWVVVRTGGVHRPRTAGRSAR